MNAVETRPQGSPIRLRDVARELEVVRTDVAVYLNKRTGECVVVTEDEAALVEGDLGRARIADLDEDAAAKIADVLHSPDYLCLPDSFEIHEWDIMRRFSESLEDEESARLLLAVLHRKGAFRGFLSELHAMGLRDAWYSYREAAFDRIAQDWLEENEIPYEDKPREGDA